MVTFVALAVSNGLPLAGDRPVLAPGPTICDRPILPTLMKFGLRLIAHGVVEFVCQAMAIVIALPVT